jgi:hypothetical protein
MIDKEEEAMVVVRALLVAKKVISDMLNMEGTDEEAKPAMEHDIKVMTEILTKLLGEDFESKF